MDGRADQYALACTAFELLTGEAPFQRDQGMAVIWAHMSQPPPPLAVRRPDLPPAADRVLARALAKAPENRYPSCAQFASELRAALGVDPHARPASPRRPAPAQLVLAAIAAVAVVIGVILAAVLLSTPSPRPGRAPAAEFTVCVDPVVACGLAQMQTKPTTVLPSADGSGLMKSLHWFGWGSAAAAGSGTYELDTCVPSCAQGHYHPSPATITLTALTPYAGGKRAYADMVISAPGAVGTSRYGHLVP